MNTLNESAQQAKLRFGIVGNAPALTAAVERAVRVAPIDLSVLVVGESGTGKEFFPKIIHAYSPRKHARYIAVNCGAIPEGTIDSELFGHEKGAFTGAVDTRKGYFEEADGGTIFLDEVAELPLTTQARLLRVLESGEFLKVGSSTVQKTNVRIVAATNVDLQRAIAEGRFREDLYYRLSTVLIALPPLRERGADIRLLARKFAADFAERYRTAPIEFGDDARATMAAYRWPGNVRQLKNVVDQLALFQAGETVGADTLRRYLPGVADSYVPMVTPGYEAHAYERERDMLLGMIFNLQRRIDHLEQQCSRPAARPREFDIDVPMANLLPQNCTSGVGAAPDKTSAPAPDAVTATPAAVPDEASQNTDTLRDSERMLIRRALELEGGHRKAAADRLNISERTLYRKIKEYGLE